MKYAYCNTVGDSMPTILEFWEIDIKKQTDLGVCKECQKLPRSELAKKSNEVTRHRIADLAIEFMKSRNSN